MSDAGARGAWRELEAKLRPFVARRVRSSVDVDDIVQEVFLRMQRGLPALRDEERFGPWVYQVARSALVDHQRVAARHRVVDAGVVDELTAEEEEDDRVAEQVSSYVAPFIAMLPSPYREALTLTELEGLTQKQAAEMLGVSLSGMKSRVQRGRVQLRRALEDCCSIALDARGRVVSCEPRPDGKLPQSVGSGPSASACCRPADAGRPSGDEHASVEGSAERYRERDQVEAQARARTQIRSAAPVGFPSVDRNAIGPTTPR
jgi:RNA polymerase sigma-70 factor (ECF subfamily)